MWLAVERSRLDQLSVDVLEKKATALDPKYAPAWSGLAVIEAKEAFVRPGIDLDRALAEGRKYAETAVEFDPKFAPAYAILSWIHLCLGNYDLSRDFLQKAKKWGPYESEVLGMEIYLLAYLGELDEAIAAAEYGLRINPYNAAHYTDAKGMALFLQGSFRDYLRLSEQSANLWPEQKAWDAAAHAHLGETAEARIKAAQFVEDFTAVWQGDESAGSSEFAHWVINANPIAKEEHRSTFVEGLRLAGLME